MFNVASVSSRPVATSRDNNETGPLEGLSTEANFMSAIETLISR